MLADEGVCKLSERNNKRPCLQTRASADMKKILILTILVIIAASSPVQALDTLSYHFNNSLFIPNYLASPLNAGDIFRLGEYERGYLNIENSGDLLNSRVSIFQPGLVTDGREIGVSFYGMGVGGTKLVWRNRLLRNPRNNRADFNRLPPLFVSGVRSTGFGALNGTVAAGGVVRFDPVCRVTDNPVTTLHYRDGYYGFEPVEAVHTRRAGKKTNFLAGGYFPASFGRFEGGFHNGHNIFTELNYELTPHSRLSAAFLNRNDNSGTPFSDRERKYNDNDWDFNYTHTFADKGKAELFGYRTWRVETEEEFHDYAKETGIGFKSRFSLAGSDSLKGDFHLSAGGYARLNGLYIKLAKRKEVRLTELETSMGVNAGSGNLDVGAVLGGYGWWVDRFRLNGVLSAEYDAGLLGVLSGSFKQSVDPHSPETMSADYREHKPTDDFNPIWRLRPELPVQGRILPVSVSRGGEVGWNRRFIIAGLPDFLWFLEYIRNYRSSNTVLSDEDMPLRPPPSFELKMSYFNRLDVNPVFWTVEGDALLVPVSGRDRRTTGWQSALNLDWNPYRANVSVMKMYRDETMERGVPAVSGEPDYRLYWEVGWRDAFWDDYFEADISFSGDFYSYFFAYGPDEWDTIGGAYPLDVRFTARIGRFTLYYGIHNWNGFPYYLVPGYRMMHKEEYFGIHWTLIN